MGWRRRGRGDTAGGGCIATVATVGTQRTTADRPTIAFLTADGVPDPVDLPILAERAEIRRATSATLGEVLPGADILLVWDFFSGALTDNWGPATADLRWVHVCAAGVDSLLFDELRESDIVLTNAAGVFDEPIAEFVLASILAQHKQLHLSKRLQNAHEWRHRETTRTAGTSALIVGTGGIGRAIARLLRAVGIHVVGAGRTARTGDPDFGDIIDSARLAEHVPGFETVIAVAPLTDATREMFDDAVFTAMSPGTHFINVGRGRLVVESALIEALESGHLGAASLDVFATEPLDADSPLWDLRSVAVSAHMSGDVAGWRDQLSAQFRANLERYLDGADLRNVVDKVAGYAAAGSVHHR